MKKIITTLATIASIASFNANAESDQIEMTYVKLPNQSFVHKENETTKLEVFYFFSYGCAYCYQFKSYLNIYLKSLDKSQVSFYYKPLKIQEAWNEYAKAHYVADGLEKDISNTLFDKVHARDEKIFTKAELSDFFHTEHNVSYPDFESAYNSYMVGYKIDKNEKLADSFGVTGTPTLVFVDSEDNVYKLSPSINGGLYKMIESSVMLTEQILNKNK